MKKILLLSSILFAISSMAIAQGPNKRGDKPHFRHEMKCCDSLKLTDDQKKQVEQIKAGFDKEKEAVLRTRITAKMQQEKIKQLRNKKREDISNVLTEEQKATWKNFRRPEPRPMLEGKNYRKDSNRRKAIDHRKRPSRDGNRAEGRNFSNRMIGGPGSVWIMNGLELSDKQKEEYKKIAEEYKKESSELQAKHRKERESIAQKQQEAIKKILTDEQKQKFEENQKRIKERQPQQRNK